MRRPPHLKRRGAVYYFRATVPKALVSILRRREITRSLQTSDYLMAKSRCALEAIKFDSFLVRVKAGKKKVTEGKLTAQELAAMVDAFFIAEEQKGQRRAEFHPWDGLELQDGLGDSICASITGLFHDPASGYPTDAPALELAKQVLKSNPGIKLTQDSPELMLLADLLRRAQAESWNRDIYRYQNQRPQPADSRFDHLSAQSPIPALPKRNVALKKLTGEFLEFKKRTTSENTPITYAIPIRILHEVLGPECPISTINQESIRRVGKELERIPSHVSQRYPSQTLLRAIAQADQAGDSERLSKHTVAKYFSCISAIFNWAVAEEWIPSAPTKGRNIRQEYRNPKRNQRDTFKICELQRIFDAPIFTGCVDDEWHFAKKGPNHPQRAKFWVPLLALFQGARLGELCQLYCQDVKMEKGVPFLFIRTELDDSRETEKRLKTENSERKVPLHPEVLRLGFLDFVEVQRKENPEGRLFPEIHIGGSTKRFSTNFSKWFARFVSKTLDSETDATFHSFRHNFRSALAQAGVTLEYVDSLCGWSTSKMERNYFHADLASLQQAVAKVSYEGLFLQALPVYPAHE